MWVSCAAMWKCGRPASLTIIGLSTFVIGPMTILTNRDGGTGSAGLGAGAAVCPE
jgi:hypothetical protein